MIDDFVDDFLLFFCGCYQKFIIKIYISLCPNHRRTAPWVVQLVHPLAPPLYSAALEDVASAPHQAAKQWRYLRKGWMERHGRVLECLV